MIFYNWLPRSFRVQGEQLSEAAYLQMADDTIKAFQRSFNLQKNALLSFQSTLWEALEQKEAFEEEDLNTWITQTEVIRLQLAAALERNELKPRRLNYTISHELQTQLSSGRQLLWNIYADFIHMTNNRLGIFK